MPYFRRGLRPPRASWPPREMPAQPASLRLSPATQSSEAQFKGNERFGTSTHSSGTSNFRVPMTSQLAPMIMPAGADFDYKSMVFSDESTATRETASEVEALLVPHRS